jgi:hypothetical protein
MTARAADLGELRQVPVHKAPHKRPVAGHAELRAGPRVRFLRPAAVPGTADDDHRPGRFRGVVNYGAKVGLAQHNPQVRRP